MSHFNVAAAIARRHFKDHGTMLRAVKAMRMKGISPASVLSPTGVGTTVPAQPPLPPPPVKPVIASSGDLSGQGSLGDATTIPVPGVPSMQGQGLGEEVTPT